MENIGIFLNRVPYNLVGDNMKKNWDKLKQTVTVNKKVVYFLVGLAIIGIALGTFYTILLQDADKTLIREYMNEFIINIKQHKIGSFRSYIQTTFQTFLFLGGIWLLGISVIGVPIMLFLYFSKMFVIGFSISNFILNWKMKGCLLSFLYYFPHGVITICIYIVLLNYAITLSLKLVDCFVEKKSIDFKYILYKYLWVFLICVVGCLLMNAYEAFILPEVLSKVLEILGI